MSTLDQPALRAHEPEPDQPLSTQLLSLTQARGAALARDDLDGFARLGGERARVLEQMRALGVTASDRAALRSVLALDYEQAEQLQARLDDLRHQLAELDHGRAALRGYGRMASHRYGILDRGG